MTAVIGRNINADISRFFLKVLGGLVPFDKVLLKINANLFRVPFLCRKTFLSWWEQCLLGWQCLSLHKLAELFSEYDSDIIIHHLLASPITKSPHSAAPQEDAELSFWPNPNQDNLWKNGSSLYKLFSWLNSTRHFVIFLQVHPDCLVVPLKWFYVRRNSSGLRQHSNASLCFFSQSYTTVTFFLIVAHSHLVSKLRSEYGALLKRRLSA